MVRRGVLLGRGVVRSGGSVLAGVLALCALAVPQTGASDYLGGGQQADVNAFLNPEAVVVFNGFGQMLVTVPIVKATTLVPQGTGGQSAELQFKFMNADPTTFEATKSRQLLDTMDLSSAGVRVVNIPIDPGRNTIVGSIIGTKPSGQRARDSDHITLICCVPEDEQPPAANAGADRTVDPGDTVMLDGTGSSDPNGDPLTYEWEQVSGPTVTLMGDGTRVGATSPTPSFIAPPTTQPVILEFDLTVNDGIWTSFPDRVAIQVIPGENQIPNVVIVAPAVVTSGDLVTLDASGSSDPEDGSNVTCSWRQILLVPTDPMVTFSDPGACVTTFVAPDVTIGTNLRFEVTVADTQGGSNTGTADVFVNPVNLAPTADAGAGQIVAEGTAVTLDGTGSTDPNPEDVLSFSWRQIPAPTVTLNGADTATPRFVAPQVSGSEVLTFELTVTDRGGLSDTDTVDITVTDSATVVTTGLSEAATITRRTR